MHNYVLPASVKARVVSRMGKLLAHDTIDAAHTALVVIDMQNYYCAPGFPLEVPMARAIVPNINRMAAAMRAAGGVVVWVQMTAAGASQHWRNFTTRMLTLERQQKRIAGLDESSEGFKLFPGLEVLASDMWVRKIKYSALVPGSSNLDAQLRARAIDTLLIAGTATNVCCESTARDAMMLDYKVIMLSDANAALTDEEHAGALNTFAMFFGDVMSTDQAIGRLAAISDDKSG
ncbi:MAG TPA: cysteine hydrolase [Candidatus Binataceae bacterium]|nr:cysteine hydrolase [Candidatus Binataceae bacterium]